MSQMSSTMFCNTCKIAGKSQREYTSHNTKTKNAKTGKVDVTCPVVLAAVCTYCNGTGHWKKYCKILEKDEKNTKKVAASVSYAVKSNKKTEKPLATNRFSVLGDDAEEEEHVVQSQQQPPVQEDSTPKITWSYIVSKPKAPIQQHEEFDDDALIRRKRLRSQGVHDDAYTSRICFDMEKNVGYMKPVVATSGVKKSWADYTSDDDESGSDEE